jgi:hypothetical protein
MTEDERDRLDLTKHNARALLIEQYRKTFGLSRLCANEEFVAHIENDEDAPVFAQAPPPRSRRKRARRELVGAPA